MDIFNYKQIRYSFTFYQSILYALKLMNARFYILMFMISYIKTSRNRLLGISSQILQFTRITQVCRTESHLLNIVQRSTVIVMANTSDIR